jgi:hypothetical protein
MADYKQSDVMGTQWRRCYYVEISNPYAGMAAITFREQDVIAVPSTNIMRDVGRLVDNFDPTRMIPLIDPATGELTGDELPEGLVYQLLYSKYMALAHARDEREAAMQAQMDAMSAPEGQA